MDWNAVGPQGPQGIQGKIGPIGKTGPQGVQGKLGPIGNTGATGPSGPQGVVGPSGLSLDGHPVVKIVSRWSNPPIPANTFPPLTYGLKVTCLGSSSTCPIVEFNGYTYWAYRFIDNRLAMVIVAYDSSNNVVQQTVLPSVRYISTISVNKTTNVITFTGQSSTTGTMRHTPLPSLLRP